MLFDTDEFTINMDIKDNNILSPYESFLRGNSFKDEYMPYKKYTYLKLNPTTKEEKLLYEIMSLCFIINDLNLYLDLHNDDKETFKLFKRYIDEEKKLKDKYIKEYGPLTLEDTLGNNFNWINDFPWENKRGDMYV